MKFADFYRNRDNHKRWRRLISLGRKIELSFTRLRDPLPPTFNATVADVLAVQWPGRAIYSREEEFYYLNFVKFYELAKMSDVSGEHREALLALHLSLEMLLKHLISKTIHYHQAHGQSPPSDLLEVFGSHDIPLISKSLMLVLTDFRNPSLLAIHSELNVMKNQLGKWAQVRYSNPYSASNNGKCQNILMKLWPEMRIFRKDLRSKGVVRWT
jgi:hypothetical protein